MFSLTLVGSLAGSESQTDRGRVTKEKHINVLNIILIIYYIYIINVHIYYKCPDIILTREPS